MNKGVRRKSKTPYTSTRTRVLSKGSEMNRKLTCKTHMRTQRTQPDMRAHMHAHRGVTWNRDAQTSSTAHKPTHAHTPGNTETRHTHTRTHTHSQTHSDVCKHNAQTASETPAHTKQEQTHKHIPSPTHEPRTTKPKPPHTKKTHTNTHAHAHPS